MMDTVIRVPPLQAARHSSLIERKVRSRSGRITPWLVALASIPGAILAWLLWLAPIPDLTAERAALAGRDFTLLWTAGRLAVASALPTLYDPAALTETLRSMFGAGVPPQIWPYPPPALILAAGLARLSFTNALVLYAVGGLAALFASLRRARLSGTASAAIILSPAVATSLLAGQNGVLIAACLAAGLSALERRPGLAGSVLGLLVIKPQFALALAPVLYATGRAKLVIGFGISAGLLCLSPLLIARECWGEFFARFSGTIGGYVAPLRLPLEAQDHFVSTFAAWRSLHFGLAEAAAAQLLVSAVCLASLVPLWRKRDVASELRLAATLAATVAAAPWVHTYDLPMQAIAIALLWPSAPTLERAALGVAWVCPTLAPLLHWPSAACNLCLFLTLTVALRMCSTPYVMNLGRDHACA